MSQMVNDDKHAKFIELLKNLIESRMQAQYDLCGEQRDWHLPRLEAMYKFAVELFTPQMFEAMKQAKDPYGNNLLTEEETDSGWKFTYASPRPKEGK